VLPYLGETTVVRVFITALMGAPTRLSSWRATRAPSEEVVVPSISAQTGRIPLKYMLTWTERPQGSPLEYENAQKRILEVFTQWKAPGNFKIELFVIRVGDWGGYMLLDCDDPTAVHKFCSMLPAFVFEARPVIPIADAVRVELEAIAFRDELKRK
jgi:muconolactone delta-isomerase